MICDLPLEGELVRLRPLGEGDVPLLCRHFLQKHQAHDGSEPTRISADTMKALETYDWPGNARELENVVERALALNDSGVIEVSDLPESVTRAVDPRRRTSGAGYKQARAAWTESQGKQYFHELLERHKGNVSSASREAQISRKSFYQLLKKFDLDPKKIG